jgi:capsular polysaccharide biosynthesis protein
MNAPMKNSSSQLDGGVYGDVSPQEDSSILDFDLAGLFRSLRRRLGLIVGITFGLTALALIAVFQVTPLYTGEAMVLLNIQKTQVIDIEAVMSGLTADSATIDSEVEILRSRSVARKVIEKLNLMNDQEINGALAPVTFIDEINPLVWVGSVIGDKRAMTEAERQASLLNAAIDTFLSREKITRNGLTYVVSVTFNSESPQKAAGIANAIADTYILDQLEAKFDATKRANEWLSQRLDALRRQVQESERAVEIYRSDNGLEGADGITIKRSTAFGTERAAHPCARRPCREAGKICPGQADTDFRREYRVGRRCLAVEDHLGFTPARSRDCPPAGRSFVEIRAASPLDRQRRGSAQGYRPADRRGGATHRRRHPERIRHRAVAGFGSRNELASIAEHRRPEQSGADPAA